MADGRRRAAAAAAKAQKQSAAYMDGGGVTAYARRYARRVRLLGTTTVQGVTLAVPLPCDPTWVGGGPVGPGRAQRHVPEGLPGESAALVRAFRYPDAPAPARPASYRAVYHRPAPAGREAAR